MHTLRSFLYYDKQVVEDFLAAVDGGLSADEKVVQTRETAGTISGEGGVAIFKGSGKTEEKSKTEITKETVVTDSAKFQRLYKYLEQEDAVRYFETMSPESWAGVSRGDLLELAVSLSFGRIGAMIDVVGQFSNMAQMVEQVTGSSLVDAQAQEAIQGFKMLGQLDSDKGIPVVMPLLGSPDYKFVAHLLPGNLKVPKDRLTGEVTVLCKIQRKLAPTDKVELFKPFGSLESLAVNRKQRRQLPKMDLPPELRDSVKGPGAMVIPVAIYR